MQAKERVSERDGEKDERKNIRTQTQRERTKKKVAKTRFCIDRKFLTTTFKLNLFGIAAETQHILN